MTPADFKGYTDVVIRAFLVVSAVTAFFGALYMSFVLPDRTLFVSLGTGALSILTGVFGFWMGASHRPTPMPDPANANNNTPEVK